MAKTKTAAKKKSSAQKKRGPSGAELARKIEELERQNALGRAAAADDPDAPEEPTSADVDQLRDKYAEWPQKGGSDVPQPWDHQALGINPSDIGPGERDTLSPVSFDHAKPVLTAGAGGLGPEGDAVADLCERLNAIGYPTTWSRGENPFNLYDASVEQAVESFRNDYGVEENPTAFGGNHPAGRELAAAHCGPVTWAAVIRVSDGERQEV